jgi:hypothetical protein
MNATAVVREAILAELASLDRNVAELNEEQKKLDQKKAKVENERRPLMNALKELTTAKNGKPSPKKKDVQPVCLEFVEARPGISKEELKKQVKDKLRLDLGFDLKGVDLRFEECLSSPMFAVAVDDTVSLADVRSDQLKHKPVISTKLPVESSKTDAIHD